MMATDFLERASGRVSAPPVPSGYTVVTLPSGGHCSFSGCVADVFEGGMLTLTSAIDGEESTLSAGSWAEAVVFDQNNQIVYGLLASPHASWRAIYYCEGPFCTKELAYPSATGLCATCEAEREAPADE